MNSRPEPSADDWKSTLRSQIEAKAPAEKSAQLPKQGAKEDQSIASLYAWRVEELLELGHVDRALQAVTEMERRGLQPPARFMHSMIHRLVHLNHLDDALKALHSMKARHIRPTVDDNNALLEGCYARANLQKAKELIGEMHLMVIEPNRQSDRILLKMYIKRILSDPRREAYGEYLAFVQTLMKSNRIPSKETLQMMQHLTETMKRDKQAEEQLQELRSHTVRLETGVDSLRAINRQRGADRTKIWQLNTQRREVALEVVLDRMA